MKAFVVDSSPRARGNSVRLCDAFVAGLDKGIEVSRVNVAAKRIGACKACNYCLEHGCECVQKDDMAELLAATRDADILALSTPVYWWGVSAQLKLYIDRLYALQALDKPFKGKKFAIVAVGEDSRLGIQYDIIKAQFRAICEFLEMDFAGFIPGSAEDREGRKIEDDAEAIAHARTVAASIAP